MSFESVCRWDGAIAAAWVQAIGSVAAIVAAIIIPRMQAGLGQRQAAAALREITGLIAQRLEDLIGYAQQGLSDAPKHSSALDLGSLESILLRFPMESLPSAALPLFTGLIGACQEGGGLWKGDRPHLEKESSLKALKNRVAEVETRLGKLD